MSQLQVTGEAKIRDIQGPVVANSGVITALDGAASQYVRGDGTLADFPTSTGGGSSVSYYLNSSVSQGTIGGVAYRQLSKTPISGAGTDITASTNGYIANYITDANDPSLLEVPAGNFNCEFYFSVNSNNHNPYVYAELYKYDGTTFTLLGSNQAIPEYLTNGTTLSAYYFAIPVAVAALTITDRLAIRIYVNVDGRTVTLHTENSHLCQVVTTFSKGLTSLNNLTRQVQFLGTGTSGTDFNISSVTATHTFNLPVASAANTGKLSSTDWSTFNNKQNALTNPITGTGASGNVAYFDGTTSITAENSFNYDASLNRLGVNTTVPNATIGANAGIDSGYSLLLKNSDSNYNGIGFGTDSTYGNLIATEKLGSALSRNLTLLNQSGFISLTEAGSLGVNILSPNAVVDIYSSTTSSLCLHTANSGITGTDGLRLSLFSNSNGVLRNNEGSLSMSSEGDFYVITIGAENIRVNSANGFVGIGNPTTLTSLLTVNGAITQSVTSALLKTNASGTLVAAVAGTDYVIPSALSAYVPTSRTLSINGETYDLSANRSWTITAGISGSGAAGRVAYYNGNTSITSEAAFNYDDNLNRFGVNTNSPNATIGANSPTDSNYSLLLKNSDTNYSGIGFATSSVYGNTIETVRIGSAPSRNLTLYNYAGYISITENGSLGVGILTPNNGIDIYNSTQSQLWLHNAASGITSNDGVRLALFNNRNANLRNTSGGLSLTAEGDFQIITIGAENFRINSANGYVGIGNPATLTSIFTVNGSITQSVTSALIKTNASGTLVAAVAGTDYVTPSGLSGYLPLSGGTLTGTLFGTSTNFSGTMLANILSFTNGTNVGTIKFGGLDASAYAFDLVYQTNNAIRFGVVGGDGPQFQGWGGTAPAFAGQMYFDYGSYTRDVAGRALYIRSLTSGSAPTVLTLNAAGNVGIGTTTISTGYASGNGSLTLKNAKSLAFNNSSDSWSTTSTGGAITYFTDNNLYIDAKDSSSNIIFRINGANERFRIATNGDTTITGTAPVLEIKSNTTGNVFLRFMNTVDTMSTIYYQSSTSTFNIANNFGGLRFNVSGTSDAFLIASTGAATFSSSVTAGDLLSTSYGSARIQVTSTTNGVNSGLRYGAKDSGGTAKNAGIYYVAGTTTATTFLSLAADDNNYQFNVLANGNVGIGTSSPLFNGFAQLTVNSTQGGIVIQASSSGISRLFFAKDDTSNVEGLIRYAHTDNSMQFFTAAAERMRITSTGNVGIGTSSPSQPLTVYAAGNPVIRLQNSTSGTASNRGADIFTDTTEFWIRNIENGFTAFATNNTERMRITSGGNVLIGSSTDYGQKLQASGVVVSVNNAIGSYASSNATTYGWFNSGGGTLILTNSGVANVGSFSMVTGVYTPSSDINKKKDFEASTIGLKEVLQLKPTLYRMKSQDETTAKELGFIAQEVKEFIPQAYVESGDFIGLNDRPFIAALVKAIQELKAEIDELKTKIK
jgi:hypothetical protein